MPRRLHMSFGWALGWIAFTALLTGSVPGWNGVDDRRVDAVLTRLEAAAIDPLSVQRDIPEVPSSVEELSSRQAMTIARAVRTMESSVDTTVAILEGDVLTPLSLARNYRHLGMRHRALRWYDGALTADKKRQYTRTLRDEISRCVAEIGDSSLVTATVRDNLALPVADSVPDANATLLRTLFDRPAGADVQQLFQDVESSAAGQTPRLRLVLAQFWEWQGQPRRAYELFRRVLERDAGLELGDAARALKGLADTAVAMGNTSFGTSLYRRYRAHDTGRLSAWSTYRLGQLGVNSGQFEEAAKNFRSICEREGTTPWKADACEQLSHARQLMEIEDALRPYGLSLDLNRRDAR